jgi:hypothetical protein
MCNDSLWSSVARLRSTGGGSIMHLAGNIRVDAIRRPNPTNALRCVGSSRRHTAGSVGPIDLIRSNTRLRIAGSVMR